MLFHKEMFLLLSTSLIESIPTKHTYQYRLKFQLAGSRYLY